MNHDVLLKRNIIGGFNRKDVIEYINQLQAECKSGTAQSLIEDTKAQIAYLRNVLAEKDKRIAELKKEIAAASSLSVASSDPIADYFSVLSDSDERIRQARAMAQEMESELRESLKAKDENIETLHRKLTSINSEIERISGGLSALTEKFNSFDFDKPQPSNDAEPVQTPTDQLTAPAADEDDDFANLPDDLNLDVIFKDAVAAVAAEEEKTDELDYAANEIAKKTEEIKQNLIELMEAAKKEELEAAKTAEQPKIVVELEDKTEKADVEPEVETESESEPKQEATPVEKSDETDDNAENEEAESPAVESDGKTDEAPTEPEEPNEPDVTYFTLEY